LEAPRREFVQRFWSLAFKPLSRDIQLFADSVYVAVTRVLADATVVFGGRVMCLFG
jgi:hypothetical protein